MLSVVMLSAIMLSVIIWNAIMLSVVVLLQKAHQPNVLKLFVLFTS
jgi:hypothetical protein